MPVIIAHQDNCEIVLYGPKEVGNIGPSLIDKARPCTCGGIAIKVNLNMLSGQTAAPIESVGMPRAPARELKE